MIVALKSLVRTEDFTYKLSSLEGRMKRDFFRFWQVHTPHYTDHGETHCKSVEMNLNELIPDDVKNDLNEYEIFLLLASVWVHDIGVMCATKTKEEAEKIRFNHHERSRQFALNSLKDLLNAQERNIIGEICFAHRDIVPIREVTLKKTVRHEALGNKVIRIRFLAGLLRLADSCDLCHTRTSEDFLDISKLPEEASFYHTLHERVSGILPDPKEKRIYIDIGSNEEKSVCQQYIVDKLQSSLNSVRDVLSRNGVYYIDVCPNFCSVSTTTKLVPPKAVEKLRPKIEDLKKKYVMLRKAREFFFKKDFKKCSEIYDKLLENEPGDALIWFLKGEALSEIGDLEEAGKCFEKSIKFDPENSGFHSFIGHFFGELCLDIKKSFVHFEKAYNLEPDSVEKALNYAESLVTVDRFEEAYNLATKYWEKNIALNKFVNAQFIRVYSLIFGHSEAKGLGELRRLIDFFKTLPPSFKENNQWVYNKIRHYVKNSTLDDAMKKLLIATLDMIEYKMSTNDFEKNFGIKLPK